MPALADQIITSLEGLPDPEGNLIPTDCPEVQDILQWLDQLESLDPPDETTD